MSLEKTDHDIRAALLPPVELLERGIRFANAWCDAQVDPMAATGAGSRLTANAVQHLLRAGPSVVTWHALGSATVQDQIELQHIDAWLTEHAQGSAFRVLV